MNAYVEINDGNILSKKMPIRPVINETSKIIARVSSGEYLFINL